MKRRAPSGSSAGELVVKKPAEFSPNTRVFGRPSKAMAVNSPELAVRRSISIATAALL